MNKPTYKEFKNAEWIDVDLSMLRIYIKATQSNLILLLTKINKMSFKDLISLSYEDLYNLAENNLAEYKFTVCDGEKVVEIPAKDISEDMEDGLVVDLYNGSYNLLVLGEWTLTDF